LAGGGDSGYVASLEFNGGFDYSSTRPRGYQAMNIILPL
jgi:hypothetical protein